MDLRVCGRIRRKSHNFSVRGRSKNGNGKGKERNRTDADTPPQDEIVIYLAEDGKAQIEVWVVPEATGLTHLQRLDRSVVRKLGF